MDTQVAFVRYSEVRPASGIPQDSVTFPPHLLGSYCWEIWHENRTGKPLGWLKNHTLRELYQSFSLLSEVILASLMHLRPSRLPTLGTAFCEKPNDTEQVCLPSLWYSEVFNSLSSPLLHLPNITWKRLLFSIPTASQSSSVTQSCPALCNPMNCSTPGLPVHHQLLESTQTHVHRVDDAIQPSHPLSSPSPPVLNLSQHQGLFQWVGSSHQVAKVLEFQPQHQSFQWTLRTDFL